MGFEVPDRRATLTLQDDGFEGAEIEVSLTVSLGTYLGIARWASAAVDVDRKDPEAVAEMMESAVRLFGDNALRGWNLQRNGVPIPATTDELLLLGQDLMSRIIASWLEAIKGGQDPLARRSRKLASTDGSSTAASSPSKRSRRTPRDSSRSAA